MDLQQPPRPPRRLPLYPFVFGGFFAAVIALNLSRTHFSLPVRSVIGQVESSPAVREALGEPVTVERFSLPLRRFSTHDTDTLTYRARLVGSRGRGELDMDLNNVDDQGWAGSYTVRTTSRSVLRDGAYTREPSREIIRGRFGRDGHALAPVAVAPTE